MDSYKKMVSATLLCHPDQSFMSVKRLTMFIKECYDVKHNVEENVRKACSKLLETEELIKSPTSSSIILSKKNTFIKKLDMEDCMRFVKNEKDKKIIMAKLELVKILY
jgi:hypothetical protein